MRQRIREMDWTTSPLGPVRTWPELLRVMVGVCVDSSFPMVVSWGPDVVLVYNDAYIPLLGSELHQHALGRPAAEVWPETWSVSSPMITEVMRRGVSVRRDDMQFVLHRNGFPEECYFTFSHSPLRDASGAVAGLFTVAAETTGHILHERRLRIAQQLGGLSATGSATPTEICAAAATVLGKARESVPFAAIYLRPHGDAARTAAEGMNTTEIRRVAAYGLGEGEAPGITSPGPDGAWTIGAVLDSGRTGVVSGLRDRAWAIVLPGPLGTLPPDQAVALPLILAGETRPIGVLLAGANPYRPLDLVYQEFFRLLGRQLSVALADSYAYHLERSRAEALADLDRVKTEFFQNVSHELRTPLTLLLAPLQDVLAAEPDRLQSADRTTVQAAVRAAQRLQSMVEVLLDFTDRPGGSLNPMVEHTDVAALTTDVASMFSSTAERTGLTLTVDTGRPVLADVDRSMWSTIVNNLLSNAIKYTRAGGIAVRVRCDRAGWAELTVSDTGVGIAPQQQKLVFERFFRADPADRSGAGIGLALVADLVNAHGGRITLTSAPGKGSAFTVAVPTGDTAPTEAAPTEPAPTEPAPTEPELTQPAAEAGARGQLSQQGGTATERRPRLLLVEDDDDLRAYLTALLVSDGWQVHPVADAEAAIDAVTGDPAMLPETVVSDIMLPGRSGLDLLTTLRALETTGRVPIILLTARAGPEAAVEGLSCGADDYITKPFSSQELLARVRVHHQLNHLREDAVGQAHGRIDQLRTALDSNRVIGTAIGMLISAHRLNSSAAFGVLVRCSQRTNRKLRDVAADVVASGSLPLPPSVTADLVRAVTSAARSAGHADSAETSPQR